MSQQRRRLMPIVIYGVLYLICFEILEQHPVRYHIINSSLDHFIPFCEYFIVPYFLWFFYIIGAVWYFTFHVKDETEFRTLIFNLGFGMTVFLIVSYIYPNGLAIRPSEFPRDNLFTDMVRFLYRIDTPTNVLPSIHVYNSVAVFCSLNNCRALQNRKALRAGALILTVLIILSTMFLKQHSLLDVALGITLSFAMYLFLNHSLQAVPRRAKQRSVT